MSLPNHPASRDGALRVHEVLKVAPEASRSSVAHAGHQDVPRREDVLPHVRVEDMRRERATQHPVPCRAWVRPGRARPQGVEVPTPVLHGVKRRQADQRPSPGAQAMPSGWQPQEPEVRTLQPDPRERSLQLGANSTSHRAGPEGVEAGGWGGARVEVARAGPAGDPGPRDGVGRQPPQRFLEEVRARHPPPRQAQGSPGELRQVGQSCSRGGAGPNAVRSPQRLSGAPQWCASVVRLSGAPQWCAQRPGIGEGREWRGALGSGGRPVDDEYHLLFECEATAAVRERHWRLLQDLGAVPDVLAALGAHPLR